MGSGRVSVCFSFLLLAVSAGSGATRQEFRFEPDTLAFANSTVFAYVSGQKALPSEAPQDSKQRPYTRRCFVMSRTVVQFYKFARFDPRGTPLDEQTLAARLRLLTRQHPWEPAWPPHKRIVFSGYANLRALSKAYTETFQKNIGLGWPTYARVGNYRMFFRREDDKYQEKTHENLDATLARGEFFVAYLSDYPNFHINHAVMVYTRKPARTPQGIERYLVYDPNHPAAPRELKWSPTLKVFNYEKDEEFVGGYTRVYQVYGKSWQ
jgi:hypothetical protein